MTDTTTNGNGRFSQIVSALKARERNSWELAQAFFAEWVPPKGRTNLVKSDYDCTLAKDGAHKGDDCCPARAQIVAGLEPMAYNTARQYRRVGEVFPVADRFDNVSFTAHKVAADHAGGDTPGQTRKAAKNILQTAINGAKNGKPTVAAVKAAVPGSTSQAGSQSGKRSVKALVDALADVQVNSHLGNLSNEELDDYIAALQSALQLAESHRNTKARRQADKAAKSAKTAKTATTGSAPKSAR